MIGRTMRSVALLVAGVLLAGGAWGQISLTEPRMGIAVEPASLALEYFGAGGREIRLSSFDVRGNVAETQLAYFALEVVPTGQAGDSVAPGNVAEITFSMAGATFSQTVGPQRLQLRAGWDCANSGAPASGAGMAASIADGGTRGDSHVTFRVEAEGASGIPSGSAICFWIPDIMVTALADENLPGGPRVLRLDVSVVPVVTTGTPFPTTISEPTDFVLGGMLQVGEDVDNYILVAWPALITGLGEGGTGLVNIMDRTRIALGGVADPSAADPASAAMGVVVGALSVQASSEARVGFAWNLDGSRRVAQDGALDPSLSGQIEVSVAGPFQDGDKVVVGTQVATPSGGMASAAVPLALETTNVVYVPGGIDVLSPSAFTASAKYRFDDPANNNDLPIPGSMGRIAYDGVNVEGYAYGLVKGGGMDTSYVRATCEAASGMCSVFLDCTDQSGMDYFGGPAEVMAGTTAVWSSDDVAQVLDGGWGTGRGRCDFHSNAPLAVQHMVRSGGTLVNSSEAVGRGLDERTDAMHAEDLMDICASVGTAPMMDDNGMVTNADAVTRCHPGMQ